MFNGIRIKIGCRVFIFRMKEIFSFAIFRRGNKAYWVLHSRKVQDRIREHSRKSPSQEQYRRATKDRYEATR